MRETCSRWIALSDRSAVGEELERADEEFLRAHGEGCTACAAEARVWAVLPGALVDPEVLLTKPEGREQNDAISAGSSSLRAPRRVGKRVALWSAALAAIAVLGVGAWKFGADAAVVKNAQVGLAFVAGDVSVNQRPARAGQKLARGDSVKLGSGSACLLFEPGVTVCARSETEFVIEGTELERRRLRLHSGSIVSRLMPQPKGSTFGVETEGGTFVAKGTSFAVEIGAGGGAELRVHEGTVSAEPRVGERKAVRAPASTSFSDKPLLLRPLSGSAAAHDARLLQLSGLWSEDATCELDIVASPGGLVALDGMELGHAPLTALVTDGSHRLGLSLAGFGPLAERLTLSRGERVARSYELTPLAVVAAPESAKLLPERVEHSTDPASPARAAPLSADELLSRAREHRAGGRYADAASAYRKLLASYPRSDQARAALVSLGELELTQLGNADSALASFDAYLRSGGALSQEARYGRIRALRKLSRLGEEKAAIKAFLLDYPRSVQAAALRARLTER